MGESQAWAGGRRDAASNSKAARDDALIERRAVGVGICWRNFRHQLHRVSWRGRCIISCPGWANRSRPRRTVLKRRLESAGMSHALMDILSRPWNHRRRARWYEPDRIVIDDLAGPTALRDLVDAFGARARVHHPERFVIVSGIDVDTALPDRVKADELLASFADEQGVAFVRDANGCSGGCGIDAGPWNESLVGSTSQPIASVGARGGICLRLGAADVAGVLATGRIWFERPVVRRIELSGQLRDGVTLHDVALKLSDRVAHDQWLVINGDVPESLDDATWLVTLLHQFGIHHVLRGDRDEPESTGAGECMELSEISALAREGAGRAQSVEHYDGLRVDRVFLGSCRSGSVRDLALAASVLLGRHVQIPTTVAPATARDFDLLSTTRIHENGPTLAEVFSSSGCVVGLPGCSGCVNALADLADGPGEDHEALTCVSTGVANEGTRQVARVLTTNPVIAARTALEGSLT